MLAFVRQQLVLLKIADGANVGGVLVDIDHRRGGDVRSAQNFAEETLGCSSIAGLIQEEIECSVIQGCPRAAYVIRCKYFSDPIIA
jgi:hypothetical protein